MEGLSKNCQPPSSSLCEDHLDFRQNGHDDRFDFHRTQVAGSFDLHRNDDGGLLAVPAEQFQLFCYPREWERTAASESSREVQLVKAAQGILIDIVPFPGGAFA